MKLSQFGEFNLIERIAGKVKSKSPRVVVGIGDDAAVIKRPKTKDQRLKTNTLITSDLLIEDVHFDLSYTSFYQLGQKALAVNLSDIAAMGGYPTEAVVTLGLPKNLKVKDIDNLYRGINRMASIYNVSIVGGDTVKSDKVVVGIALLGEVEARNVILRSGARVGDQIVVLGSLGKAAKALAQRKCFVPKPQVKEARIIAKSHLATSMIDNSDGLARSIIEITKSSGAGARIFLDELPVAPGATHDQAFYGGEDYNLILTVPKNKLKKLKSKIKLSLTVVGEIVKKSKEQKLKDKGYDHFTF